MKQTAVSADRAQVLNLGDEGSLVSLGRYEDVVWGHDPSREMLLDLAWTPPRPLQLAETERDPVRSIEFETALSGRGGSGMRVEQFTYETNALAARPSAARSTSSESSRPTRGDSRVGWGGGRDRKVGRGLRQHEGHPIGEAANRAGCGSAGVHRRAVPWTACHPVTPAGVMAAALGSGETRLMGTLIRVGRSRSSIPDRKSSTTSSESCASCARTP